jgi:hypothetical protein
MNEDKNETIEITVKSAWVAMECLNGWLEYIDCLDDETRRQVIALDEIVQALDAESFITPCMKLNTRRDKLKKKLRRRRAKTNGDCKQIALNP